MVETTVLFNTELTCIGVQVNNLLRTPYKRGAILHLFQLWSGSQILGYFLLCVNKILCQHLVSHLSLLYSHSSIYGDIHGKNQLIHTQVCFTSCRGQLRVFSSSNLHVFGQWEETGVNPLTQGEHTNSTVSLLTW